MASKPPILIMMASVSGFVGTIFGTPSDNANIRIQNDSSLPEHLRRNYRGVLDAWVQMSRQEGWVAFTKGLWPNCFRCVLMTSRQLASYDSFKALFTGITGLSWDSLSTHGVCLIKFSRDDAL